MLDFAMAFSDDEDTLIARPRLDPQVAAVLFRFD